MNGLDELRRRHPWPEMCPDVPSNPGGWFAGENQTTLAARIARAAVVLELGAWLGMSTRFLVARSPATVITIDHWQGSPEHRGMPELATLWETFCRNCWECRARLIPVRDATVEGMQVVASLGIRPDVIYVDAAHEAEGVEADLRAALGLWPAAHIVGDDWTWASVRAGVVRVISDPACTRQFVGRTTCYEIFPEGAHAPV